MRKHTVLLVAFDDLSRRLTQEGLELYDHDVVSAAGSDAAADILRSGRRVGALVVDLDLAAGAVDGLALARLAREIDSRTLVVYVSRRPQSVPEHRKVPGAPTLRSPFFPHQLTGVLAELRSDRVADRTSDRANRGAVQAA